MKGLLVWVPEYRSEPPDPEVRPISHGVKVYFQGWPIVFGEQLDNDGRATGWMIEKGHWKWVKGIEISGLWDRYPDRTRPKEYAQLLERARSLGLVIFNLPEWTQLCHHKVLLQQYVERRLSAEIEMPEQASDLEGLKELCCSWIYLKPVKGSFGEGIEKRRANQVQSLRGGYFAQCAKAAPEPWASLVIRALVQREKKGWFIGPLVIRRSKVDAIASARRGAEVIYGPGAIPEFTYEEIQRQARVLAEQFERDFGTWVVEFGADFIVDQRWKVYLIEVNAKPKGRYIDLAKRDAGRYLEMHLRAVTRPLLYGFQKL